MNCSLSSTILRNRILKPLNGISSLVRKSSQNSQTLGTLRDLKKKLFDLKHDRVKLEKLVEMSRPIALPDPLPALEEESTSTDPSLEETKEVISFAPEVFHTRSLEVHEAFRRFRPPRETWMVSFNDHSKRGLIELHPEMFASNPRLDQIYEVIKWQDACVREDDIEYTRAELPGSGNKGQPQKGTGKARRKGIRAPNFKYGGRPLGRRPRDHGFDIDLNVLVAGFAGICTGKHSQGDLYIVDSLKNFTIPSLLQFKYKLNTESVLFVTGYEGLSSSQNAEICFHPGIDLLTTETVHPKAILGHLKLVMDLAAVQQLEEWVLDIKQEHSLNESVDYHNHHR